MFKIFTRNFSRFTFFKRYNQRNKLSQYNVENEKWTTEIKKKDLFFPKVTNEAFINNTLNGKDLFFPKYGNETFTK